MKISYNWLQTYFDEKLPEPEKIAELFNTHSFEVEEIKDIKKDTIFDIKVLPDRAHYALCHRGVAKELSVLTGISLKDFIEDDFSVDNNVDVPNIYIENKQLCKRYMIRRIDNITIEKSVRNISERLENIEQRSINSIVDITNFIMFDIGQPLHAFDADKVVGDIVIRNAKKDEKIIILDGTEKVLLESDLVVADSVGLLAIAGVKGGKRAEVDLKTKSILVESANFDPVCVRKTANRLNLKNESSKRFENEITPELCEEALNKFCQIISKDSNVKIGEVNDLYINKVKPWQVSTSIESIRKTIGVEISGDEIINILEKMNCFVKKDNDILTIAPPVERLDILIPEDIADEIGRIYGYNKLPSILPPDINTNTQIDKDFYYGEKIKNILNDNGFSEVMTYALGPKGDFEIAYPLASDKSFLRSNLSFGIRESLVMNYRNADFLELDQIKIFEIGKIFTKEGEKNSLCIGVSLVKKIKGLDSNSVVDDIIKKIENNLNIKLEYNIDKKDNVSIVEIDITEIVNSLPEVDSIKDLNFKPLSKDIKYKPFSQYPFAVRDIAIFVPIEIEEKEISNLIKDNAGQYFLKMRLFDTFQKKDENGIEKKSYAFRIVFQSYDKTLEEKDITESMNNIVSALNKREGWLVR